MLPSTSAPVAAVSTEFPGNLLVVCAPSGAGKSSLTRALLAADADIRLSVSYTTRPPRRSEVDGVNYRFINQTTFEAKRAAGELLEWALVHGHYYGTSRDWIEERMRGGGDVLLEIDWQGALQVRALFHNAVLVFILPPSLEELERRLHARGEDDGATVVRRLANAREEIAQAPRFDFTIVNEDFDHALCDLQAILRTQRLRFRTQQRHRPEVFARLGLS